MKEHSVKRGIPRQDRLLHEHNHDPYRIRRKLLEPTCCPQCGAVYHSGRWTWSKEPAFDANEELCQACRRINDNYPAGEIRLRGSFLPSHREEIINLARNIERSANEEHPLHRIMSIEDQDGETVITIAASTVRRTSHGAVDGTAHTLSARPFTPSGTTSRAAPELRSPLRPCDFQAPERQLCNIFLDRVRGSEQT